MKRVAFITGVSGQDGSYLSEFLLEKDYDVVGLVRYCSETKRDRLKNVINVPKFSLVYGDLTDSARLAVIINSFENYDRIEIYNLGALSHVQMSFEQPELTTNIDALGTLRILEIIRQSNFRSKIRFYQAGTSEMFGKICEDVQKETTPFYPRSPYGVAKVYAYWITKNYREAWDIFSCTGILFNHESERRGPDFVTRKITMGINNWIKTGEPIRLGNLNSSRDWGHAEDYVVAMWLMLQQDVADDYVIGSDESHTVREFINEAVKYISKTQCAWVGEGLDEKLIVDGRVMIVIDPNLYRPAEVDALISDCTKARTILCWKPKVSFKQLVKRMMNHDVILGQD
jgi:GDPmannose 4,6-dehydratase